MAYGVHLVGNIESSNHSVLHVSILIELHTDVKKGRLYLMESTTHTKMLSSYI